MAIKIRKKNDTPDDAKAPDAPDAVSGDASEASDVSPETGALTIGEVSVSAGSSASTGDAQNVTTGAAGTASGQQAPSEPEVEVLSAGGRARPPVGGDGIGLQLTGAEKGPEGPNVADWLQDNNKKLMIAIAVLLVGVVVYQIASSMYESAQISESDSLTDAIHVYDGWTNEEGQDFQLSPPPPPFDKSPKAKPAGRYKDDAARHAEALSKIDAALNEYGDDDITAEAQLLKASILLNTGKPGEAVAAADAAAEGLGEHGALFTLQIKASALVAEGKYDDALGIYKQINALDSTYRAVTLADIVRIHEMKGDLPAAAAAYKAAIDDKVIGFQEQRFVRARLAMMVGDVGEFLGDKPSTAAPSGGLDGGFQIKPPTQ